MRRQVGLARTEGRSLRRARPADRAVVRGDTLPSSGRYRARRRGSEPAELHASLSGPHAARALDPADLLAVLLDPPTQGEGGRSVRVCLLVADDEGLTTFLAGVVGALRDGPLAGDGATPVPVEPAPGVRPAGGRDEQTAVPSEPAPASADLSELTPRELDVLDLVARGEDNATIASRLGLSTRTVRNHLNSVFSKLNVTYRPQAVVLAREAGLGRGAPRFAGRSASKPR